MGYLEDYNREKMGIPTGKIWSLGAQQARDEKRWEEERWRNNNSGGGGGGGGTGCGYVILFFVALQLLPVVIPITISALLLAIVINKFGDKILLLSSLPTFKQAFRVVFYTYLWYMLVSTIVGFGAMFIMNFSVQEIDNIDFGSSGFYKLCLQLLALQILTFLITGAIFRRYVSRSFDSEIPYWRATLFINSPLIIWFVIIGAGFYFGTEYYPVIQEMIQKL